MQSQDISYYDDLIDIIYDYEDFIEKNYKDKDDQIFIQNKLLTQINNFVKQPIYHLLNKNEIIKTALKDVLELSSDDIIIIKDSYIFIKLYDDNKRAKVLPTQVNTSLNRYNGIDEDELELFYAEYFTKDDIKDLFNYIAELTVEKYFIKSNISNNEFEENIFKIIQNLIMEDMALEFDSSYEFNKGFSGYVFRKHFKLAFSYLAESLLRGIAHSNKYVIEFLKYYSLDIVVINKTRYKVPELTTENGLKWHAISMMSIAKSYIQAQEFILEKKSSLKKFNQNIKDMNIDNLTPFEHNEMLTKELLDLEILIKKNDLHIEKIYDFLEISKDKEEILNAEYELEEYKIKRQKYKEIKSKLQHNKIQQIKLIKYEKLLNNIYLTKKEISSKSKVILQNKQAFDSMKGALSRALSSKKKAV